MKYVLLLVLIVGLGACGQAHDASLGTSAATPARGGPGGLQAAQYAPPIQALVAKGVIIKGSLPAPPGYKGYLADYDGQPVPVYLLPDGQHAVVGTLLDAAGNDLTIGPFQDATTPVLSDADWKQLADAAWIAEGAKHPKRIVYEFTDTECPYCHRLWAATQPLLVHGDVQVRHVIVAVIAPQSAGRAAALLDARDPSATLRRHQLAFDNSPVAPLKDIPMATARRIEANNALMQNLGIGGTPGVVYKDKNGKVRLVVGLPPPERIRTIFGN